MRVSKSILSHGVIVTAAILGSHSANAQCPAPTDGLKAYYPLDGDTLDASGNGRNGTALNGAAPTADRFGVPDGAYYFDGVNDNISIGAGLFNSSALTIAAWFKQSEVPTYRKWRDLVAGSCGTALLTLDYYHNRPAFGGQCDAPFGMTNAAPVTDADWHHVVATYGGGQVKIYVDGNLSSASNRGGNFNTGLALYIGAYSAGGSEAFAGSIDEVYLYDRVLTQCEVQGVYNAQETLDSPPIANAGVGQSVNEGQTSVVLDGSGSNDPDSDPLTYAWSQLSGTSVALSGATTAQPAFTAPMVALGGETLTFELTVAANGESATDTVDVSVVNVNHPPVAEAGADLSIAEGSLATLQGGASFDIDMDSFTYSWTQTGGLPIVTLTGADTANPTFDAPYYGTSGAPGVVGTLVFELEVDDDFPQDAPAPGYALADVVDCVTIQITNINNVPTANADIDQVRDENASVTLSGMGSSDPDGDSLTYAWTQTGGTFVTIFDAASVAPSFTTPFVNPGGEDLTFELTVNDGYSGMATDTMVVHVQNANDPPNAAAARPSIGTLWPPNHKMVSISITGVTDPNDNATIIIDGVTQDEPTAGTGDGDTAIDAIIKPDGTVLVRAERSGSGDGRVYHIYFTASDLEGSTSGVVTVSVPKKKKQTASDGGSLHDSTN